MLTDGLLSYYKFESNANDSVGANNGSISGATICTGILGSAYLYDGTNDNIFLGSSPTLDIGTGSECTVTAWVKTTSTSTDNRLLRFREAAGTSYFIFQLVAGSIQFAVLDQFGNGLNRIFNSTVCNNGSWNFIAGKLTNLGSMHIYLNGSLVTNNPHAMLGSIKTVNKYIGRDSTDGFNSSYAGSLDELSFYSRALTDQEISRLYNEGVGITYPFPMPRMQINIGDAWKTVVAAQINIGDAWKIGSGLQLNISDTWTQS